MPSTSSYIWKFKKSKLASQTSHANPAPDLEPMNKNMYVDVVKDFNWTQSPRSSRVEVPIVELKEKRIKFSALINQLLYYGATLKEESLELFNQEELTTAQVGEQLDQLAADKIGFNTGGAAEGAGASVDTFIEDAGKFLGVPGSSTFDGVLKAYNDLYITEDTGWNYEFPYFDNQFRTANPSFGSGAGNAAGGGFGKLISGATSFAKDLAESAALFGPLLLGSAGAVATYIEEPKAYQFSPTANGVNITFPLINTEKFEDVIKNWQLVYLLLYQNLPNRITRAKIDPSVIYEMNIDGVYYNPFMYMNNVHVEFAGARREMEIPVPVLDENALNQRSPEHRWHRSPLFQPPISSSPEASNQNTIKYSAEQTLLPVNKNQNAIENQNINNETKIIKTVIPDAYQVTINLESLIGDTKNLMYAMIENKQDIVSVSEGISETAPDLEADLHTWSTAPAADNKATNKKWYRRDKRKGGQRLMDLASRTPNP